MTGWTVTCRIICCFLVQFDPLLALEVLLNTSDYKKFSMRAICLWSGPRNVYTAVMYSFAQRPDTCVVDEPLYGHFLRVTGALHPGREEVMVSVDCDGDKVMMMVRM